MTDAGPLDLLDANDSDDDNPDASNGNRQIRIRGVGNDLPGAAGKGKKPVVRVKDVRFSPAGQSWAAATTEGVVIFSLDEGLVFDPIDLDIEITPEAVTAATAEGQHARAIQMALQLNEPAILHAAMIAVPVNSLSRVVTLLPRHRLPAVVTALATLMGQSPSLEYLLTWTKVSVLSDVMLIDGLSEDRGQQGLNRW